MLLSADFLPAFRSLTENPSLVQQSHILRLLNQSLIQQQLHHAYLIKGPIASGLEISLALARALFCPQRGCGQCHVCLAVSQQQYPDLHIVQPEGEGQQPMIKLKQIHQLVEQVSLPPVQSSHQLFILVQADRLNKESSNALLKTLEEPASNSIMILLTPIAERILPTIRSRSQLLALPSPLPDVASLRSQSAEPQKFWDWERIESIQTPTALMELQEHLESLSLPELSLQLQIFQRGCWSKIREFIISKHSPLGLKRAYAYLELFENAFKQLKANAHPKLVISSLSQRFLALRRQR